MGALKTFVPLQTLFPYLKIVIFCRIVPYFSLKNSANVGQFYPLKTTIFYKVAPRKFHIIINIAPLKNPLKHKAFPFKEMAIFFKIAPIK